MLQLLTSGYGTSQTSRDVRLESAKWAKADIGQVTFTIATQNGRRLFFTDAPRRCRRGTQRAVVAAGLSATLITVAAALATNTGTGRPWRDTMLMMEVAVPDFVMFEEDDPVRVVSGPFTSFNGVVEEVDEARSRLKVAVYIYGRVTRVELEFGQVEKA